MTGRLIARLAISAVAVMTLASCAGAPDRSAEARQLESTLSATPGVTRADVRYENADGRGSTLDVDVWLPEATGEQITAAVGAIEQVRGDKFDKFEQHYNFWIAAPRRKLSVQRGDRLDAAEISRDAVALRGLAARFSAGEVSWYRGADESTLRLIGLRTPTGETLNMIRAGLGPDTEVTVDLRPAFGSPAPMLKVDFPFSAQQQDDIERRFAQMPASVVGAVIENNATIRVLTVALDQGSSVAQQVREVIDSAGANEQHPMWLRWLGPKGSRPGSNGFVTVGECDYPDDKNSPTGGVVEQQLRREFDTC